MCVCALCVVAIVCVYVPNLCLTCVYVYCVCTMKYKYVVCVWRVCLNLGFFLKQPDRVFGSDRIGFDPIRSQPGWGSPFSSDQISLITRSDMNLKFF